jgi:hypothetical protein
MAVPKRKTTPSKRGMRRAQREHGGEHGGRDWAPCPSGPEPHGVPPHGSLVAPKRSSR